MSIEIREHVPGKDLNDFIRAGHVVFEGDPNWIPPLEFELRERLNPKKNPFFLRSEVALFTAWRNGHLVGRISAQVSNEHLERYHDAMGFFGFFDTIDDDAVGVALIDAASEWLAKRGMRRMRGPLSLSMNEELGTLVDGFDTPPAFLMAHSRRWQDRVAKAAGLEKARDLYAWRFEIGTVPNRALKAWEAVQAMPEVKIRSVELKHMGREFEILNDIYNDAWQDNWGYVPATPEEIKKTGEDLKLILDPEIAVIAEIEGKPAAICICLPNVNEVTWDFGGKLNPITIAKLIWRLKVTRPKSSRLMLLGIKSEFRHVRKYAALSHALYVEIAKRGERRGYRWGELSWTLEDNRPINLGIQSMGAKVYKTYRIFEKPIAASAE